MELTEDQLSAFEHLKESFKTHSTFLLYGSAGTGKTTLTKHIAKYFSTMNYPICAIAPTHKAKRVIEAILNEKRLFPVPAFTVASIMGKIKEHSYIGTKNYSNPNNKKFSSFRLFILDEVSMVADQDLEFIMNYVKVHNKKLLVIGDCYQIPCPSAPYIVTNIVVKADSFIFSKEDIPKFELTEIKRQAEDSPILKLAWYVRDNILNEFTIWDTGYTDVFRGDEIYDKFIDLYMANPLSTKIIAYTNQAVYTHNCEVRLKLNYEAKFVVNELLTGYASTGFPELFIENGQDYVVVKIEETNNYIIDVYRNLCGHLLDLSIVNTPTIEEDIFFIDVGAEENLEFLQELIRRSEKVNAIGSTKIDYIKYNELKNMAVFMEDVYKFNGDIFREADFKEAHVLLFTKITELIKDNRILKSKLADKIQTEYPDILESRLTDTRKPIGDSETLADRFKCVEKDIYYGYAITAHKSQGSTYQSVVVDENDFSRIQDRVNFKYNKMERRTKEKNQLKYVSYTRAKQNLHVIYDGKENVTEVA
jgi:GTPase SAR1 family protein